MGMPFVKHLNTEKKVKQKPVDNHLQQLQQLHELQQQQIEQLQMIQQQLQQPTMPMDPATAAAALLDPNTSEAVIEALKKAAKNDDISIDENASAAAIATALFGPKNDQHKGKVITGGRRHSAVPDESVSNENARLYKSAATLDEYFNDDDLKSLKMDDTTSWVQSFQSMDTSSMGTHSLGQIGESRKELKKKQNSKMSMISELTDAEPNPKSTRSMQSRTHKMEVAKNLNSNISMLSELTDMTGDFSILSLNK